MKDNKQVRLTEVFDESGNMLKIIADDVQTGEHIIDILWDPNDNQDEKTRDSFRQWASTMLVRKGYESIN